MLNVFKLIDRYFEYLRMVLTVTERAKNYRNRLTEFKRKDCERKVRK